jgi:prepilin-type N-terminal cleavage/methylation domain-containing protein
MRTSHVIRRGVARTKGFTLLEISIALTLGAMVLLSARLLLETISDTGARIREEAANADATANAERLLRSVLGRAEGDTAAAHAFEGSSHAATFTSWCDVAGGWQERCRIKLAIERTDSLTSLSMWQGVERRIELRADVNLIALGYLSSSDTGLVWLARWDRSASVPAAVALFAFQDTMILRVGITP